MPDHLAVRHILTSPTIRRVVEALELSRGELPANEPEELDAAA